MGKGKRGRSTRVALTRDERRAMVSQSRQAELEDLVGEGFDLGLMGLADKFLLSIRGPLKHQADVLLALQEITKSLEGVSVEIGTVRFD